MKKHININEKYFRNDPEHFSSENFDREEKIISAAYGSADLFDKIKICIDSLFNSEVRAVYKEYKETAAAVKSLPKVECPDEVILKVHKSIEQLKSITAKHSITERLFSGKPAFASLAALAAVIGIIGFLIFRSPVIEQTYSQQEIETAEKQLRYSFERIGLVFKKTRSVIEEEVLPKQVGQPILKSINKLNDLLLGG
jgi:hypothetical protein